MDIKEYTRRMTRLVKVLDFMKLLAFNDKQEKRYINKALTECLEQINRKARGVYNKSEALEDWIICHTPIIDDDIIHTLELLESSLKVYTRYFKE